MFSAKVVVALLAVLGSCQSAKVPARPTKDGVDIAVVVQDVIKIVQVIVKAVDGGINEADPILDDIGTYLPQEVADAIKGLRDDILGIVRDVEARVEVIIKEVEDAITELDKIRSCTDEIADDSDAILSELELGILGVIRKAETDNAEGLANVQSGVERIVGDLRVLFDETLAKLVKCLAPGAKGADQCVKDTVTAAGESITSIGADLLLFVSEVIDALSPFIGQIVNGSLPLINDAVAKGDPLLTQVSGCIEKL